MIEKKAGHRRRKKPGRRYGRILWADLRSGQAARPAKKRECRRQMPLAAIRRRARALREAVREHRPGSSSRLLRPAGPDAAGSGAERAAFVPVDQSLTGVVADLLFRSRPHRSSADPREAALPGRGVPLAIWLGDIRIEAGEGFNPWLLREVVQALGRW